MPILKSSIKKARQSEVHRKRNLITKNRFKDLSKQYHKLLEEGKTQEAALLLPKVEKSLDMAGKKNLIPKNTVSRKKSLLARSLTKKPSTESVTAKKTAPKKEKVVSAPKVKAAPKAKTTAAAPKKATTAKKTTAKKAA